MAYAVELRYLQAKFLNSVKTKLNTVYLISQRHSRWSLQTSENLAVITCEQYVDASTASNKVQIFGYTSNFQLVSEIVSRAYRSIISVVIIGLMTAEFADVLTESVCQDGVDSSYADSKNCRGYIVCVAGERFHFDCPGQLVFNFQLHFCDFDLHNSCPQQPHGKLLHLSSRTNLESFFPCCRQWLAPV